MKAVKVETRYVGIDLGKRNYEVAIVGKGGKVTMSNGKTNTAGRQALYKKLRPSDKVAIEAGNMAFLIAKEIILTVGCTVYILNPSKLAVIYTSMKKTDKEDALKLAHILEDFNEARLPTVPVPSDKEMYRRKLVASYQRMQKIRTSCINQLHNLFVSLGITTVVRKDLATSESRKEQIKSLSGLELEEAEYLVANLDLCEARLATIKERMEEDAKGDNEIERLDTIPGVGSFIAFVFLSYVSAARFDNSGQVSNYLGLVPRVYMSGDTSRYGSITKRGNGYVRSLLVQAAWALVRSKNGGSLKAFFEEMTIKKSMSRKKAIVAVARRLAELMYTLLKDGTNYTPKPVVSKSEKDAKNNAAAKSLARAALSA